MYSGKDVKRMRRQGTDWEKSICKRHLIKNRYTRWTKNSLNSTTRKWKLNKKAKNPIEEWAKDLNRYLKKKDILMANKHMKTCSTSNGIRKLEIKTTMRYYYTPIRMTKIQKTEHTKCWRGCGVTGTLIHCWWECKMVQPLWKTIWQCITKLDILLLSSNCASTYLCRGAENLCPRKNVHTHVYNGFIHNCHYLKATKMSFSE